MVPFKVILVPEQTTISLPALTVKLGLTVTTTWSVLTQPFASVTVNVYVVLIGDAVAFNATNGTLFVTPLFHVFVFVPVAAKVMFAPVQTTWSTPALATKTGLTETTTLFVALHPLAVMV